MDEETKKELSKIVDQLYGFSALALRVPTIHKLFIRKLAKKLEEIIDKN